MKQKLSRIGWEIVEYLRRMATPFILNLMFGITMFAVLAIGVEALEIILIALLYVGCCFAGFVYFRAAGEALKFGGKFFVIVSSERLPDLFFAMRMYEVEPKVLTPVQPTPEKDINTVIVTGIKCGKPGLKVTKPLIITNADGSYTETVRRMYFNDGRAFYSRDPDRKP